MIKYTHVEIYEMGLEYSKNHLSKLVEPDYHKREALAFEVGYEMAMKNVAGLLDNEK